MTSVVLLQLLTKSTKKHTSPLSCNYVETHLNQHHIHRMIMHTPPSTNTRHCCSLLSSKPSMRNQDPNECGVPRYVGVRKRKWGRWVSEIREPGKKTRIWLGSFDTPEMAAAAYDVAAWYLKGPDARINFPELVESLPKPASADADDVRQAAQQAAMRLGGARSGDLNGGSGGFTVPARVELSPSHIQAINESPLDSPKMWMELAGPSEPVNYGEMEMDMGEWDEMESYPIWD